MIDRDKYRRLFIDESRESLRALNNELVALEKIMAAGGAAEGAVAKKRAGAMDAAFRTAHSLKGMGASMGYQAFADLAHKLEDLADLARQGHTLGPAAFDLLLEASDVLEAMVEKVADGKEQQLDAGDLTSRIAAHMDALRPAPADAAPVVATAAVVSESTGDSVTVRVRIADGASLPQVRAFVVHKALSALPGYRSTEPTAESIRAGALPDRTIIVRFDPATADVARIESTAQGAQGVGSVVVTRGEPAQPPPAPAAEEAGDKAERNDEDRTVRVRTAILDEFIDSVGELLLARSRLRALATKYDSPELGDLVDEVERLTRELHDRVVAARMTPLAFITERLPRIVRDLARQEKKAVELTMDGTAIELDRSILDELFTPLIHMLRNAVDHAHEGKERRRAAGKPEAMKLSIRASRDRDQVLIDLIDDGGGIDPEAVKARAVDRGLLDAQAAAGLTHAQALELICLPGFSTAAAVSQTSGRGVGMDVVKASLERMGGVLRIESVKGQGTHFTLQLPLTVAIIQVLVVEAGQGATRDAYAIPVNRVEHAVDLDATRIAFAQGRAFMKEGDDLVPLYDLSHELGFPGRPLTEGGTAILVGRGQDLVAFRVDAVLGQEEVVAKPLGRPLSSFGYLAGATLLADGRAAFILEPHRLVSTRIVA